MPEAQTEWEMLCGFGRSPFYFDTTTMERPSWLGADDQPWVDGVITLQVHKPLELTPEEIAAFQVQVFFNRRYLGWLTDRHPEIVKPKVPGFRGAGKRHAVLTYQGGRVRTKQQPDVIRLDIRVPFGVPKKGIVTCEVAGQGTVAPIPRYGPHHTGFDKALGRYTSWWQEKEEIITLALRAHRPPRGSWPLELVV